MYSWRSHVEKSVVCMLAAKDKDGMTCILLEFLGWRQDHQQVTTAAFQKALATVKRTNNQHRLHQRATSDPTLQRPFGATQNTLSTKSPSQASSSLAMTCRLLVNEARFLLFSSHTLWIFDSPTFSLTLPFLSSLCLPTTLSLWIFLSRCRTAGWRTTSHPWLEVEAKIKQKDKGTRRTRRKFTWPVKFPLKASRTPSSVDGHSHAKNKNRPSSTLRQGKIYTCIVILLEVHVHVDLQYTCTWISLIPQYCSTMVSVMVHTTGPCSRYCTGTW